MADDWVRAVFAGLADGTHTGGGFNTGGNWNYRERTTAPDWSALQQQIPHWVIPTLIAVGVLVVLVFVPFFMWIGSRGRFIFIDCIVRNRGAIVEPWRQFARDGNRLFVFKLIAFRSSVSG